MTYQRADVYDALYQDMKNYFNEADWATEIAIRYLLRYAVNAPVRSKLSLLDVACGTGLHLQYFSHWFGYVEGVDSSEVQLAAARDRLDGVKLSWGDMRSFSLTHDEGARSTFDVVTCLFSAIGHMLNIADLQQAIATMAGHLKPGGVLLVEPWLMPDRWESGRISLETVDYSDLKIARVTRSELHPDNITYLEMHYTVGTSESIEHYVERHKLALYAQEEYESAFNRAGLEFTYDPFGISNNHRGLFIGVKPI